MASFKGTHVCAGPAEATQEQSVDSCKLPLRRRVVQSIKLQWTTFSDLCIDWTPFVLCSCYWPTCTAIFVMSSSQAIEIFYYCYMIANLVIAVICACESLLSLTPVREARKAALAYNESGGGEKSEFRQAEYPAMNMVIVAYLPNEQKIVKRQLLHALEEVVYPRDKLKITLVYNTPYSIEPLESELREMESEYEQLRIVKVPQSTSKAENINYFLSLIRMQPGEYVGIFDTDHLPHPHNARWAAERILHEQPAIVQGRCVVYNTDQSFLAKMVAIEFDKIYAIAHPGRSRMCGFGLFCGSNGWWRADLLQQLRMRGEMLTEDIDSALRVYARGEKTVHDLNVISYELSPNTLSAFWKQRMRWTQGWTQISWEHMSLICGNPPAPRPKRTFAERYGLFSLLLFRELSYYFVSQHTCLILSFVINGWPSNVFEFIQLIWFSYPFAEWFFIIVIVALIITLLCTDIVRSEFTRFWMMLAFGVVYAPYLILQSHMGIYGHARQLIRYAAWNPTERQ